MTTVFPIVKLLPLRAALPPLAISPLDRAAAAPSRARSIYTHLVLGAAVPLVHPIVRNIAADESVLESLAWGQHFRA